MGVRPTRKIFHSQHFSFLYYKVTILQCATYSARNKFIIYSPLHLMAIDDSHVFRIRSHMRHWSTLFVKSSRQINAKWPWNLLCDLRVSREAIFRRFARIYYSAQTRIFFLSGFNWSREVIIFARAGGRGEGTACTIYLTTRQTEECLCNVCVTCNATHQYRIK